MEYSEIEIENIKKSFEITEVEFNDMFEKCKYATFYKCEPCEKPKAIFVGGQTGSGKGGIDVFSEQEFKKENKSAALVDIDVYRALYPRTSEILEKYPTIYTDITAKTTGKIVKKILQYAIDNKYNFIFEGTLKNTEAFETMKAMPKYFTKIVRVMAVPKFESLLTAFERNDEQVNLSGYGRFTNVSTHNKTYVGVLDTIKIIEQQSDDITIEVFIRGKDMTSPIKVFNSKENENKSWEVIEEHRAKMDKNKIDVAIIRLNKLLSNLRPKDKYEEEQLRKLENEIKSII